MDSLIRETNENLSVILSTLKNNLDNSESTLENIQEQETVAQLSTIQTLVKNVLKDLFGFVPETIIVTEPRYFKNFNQVLNEETLEQYKHWAYVTGFIGSFSFSTATPNGSGPVIN